MVQPSLELASQNHLGNKIPPHREQMFPKKASSSQDLQQTHTLKLSYPCMPNMKSIIASHNKTVLSNYTSTPATEHVKECNCRKKEQCPLEGQCLANNIVYRATVTSNTTTETYVGLTTNFKERYRNHTSSFRNHNDKHETELSKYIWTLTNANKPFNIKWRILRKM